MGSLYTFELVRRFTPKAFDSLARGKHPGKSFSASCTLKGLNIVGQVIQPFQRSFLESLPQGVTLG